MAQISLEVRDIVVLGIPSGFGHLNFVYKNDIGKEFIVTAGSASFFPFYGDLVADSGVAIGDENSNPTATVKGVKLLDFGDRDLEDVWSLLVQHGEQVDAEGLSYELLDQNSNSAVSSLLHMAGLVVDPALPDSSFSLPGIDNLLTFGYVLIGTDSSDAVQVVAGNDSFTGAAGNDFLIGNSGGDRFFGGSGNDFLYDGSGSDHLDVGQGNDSLHGEEGDDSLIAGSGNDQILAGQGQDCLYGGSGRDRLVGGSGSDKLFGAAKKTA